MRMASMNMSLDDIIQKKAVKFSGARGKGRLRKGQTRPLPGNRGQQQLKGNIQIRRRRAPPLGDARFRIIQKYRQKLTDAREKLAEIAKQHDARIKLDKLRQIRVKERSTVLPGSNITRKTGRNGQITLSTNRKRDVTMRNGRPTSTRGFMGALPSLLDLDVDMGEDSASPPVIRRTVSNNMSSQPSMYSSLERNRYSWMNESSAPIERRQQKSVLSESGHRASSSSLKIVARNTAVRALKSQSSATLSERDEWRSELEDSEDDLDGLWSRNSSTPVGRMSSELKARLDTPASSPRTMGILSSASTKPPTRPLAPPGYRIVVSNLQPSVTQEDIRELFEDIGTLLASRLVRPGTAEVIYAQHKDALKAVDVYHNRQLDGQPMKCMLVNTRPPGVPTASRTSGSGLRSSSDASLKLPSGGKSSVAPDIGTIHKALFNKS